MAEGVRIDYEKLKRKREESKLGQAKLCKKLGLRQSSYCRWEQGKMNVCRESAKKLERFFGCELIFEPLRINPESLKKIRLEKGIKRKDLAGRLELNLSTIYNWEAGRIHPSQKYVDKLIDIFGVGVLKGEEDFVGSKSSDYIDDELSEDIDELLEQESQRLEYAHKVFAGKV